MRLNVSQTEEELLDERLTQVEEIMKNYAHIRVYTLGKYGSWICIDSHSSVNIPVFKVEVMNRTGAGDTFAAGFIAYMFEHILNVEDFRTIDDETRLEMLSNAARFASAAAAIKVSTGKAPSRTDLDAFLDSN